MANNKEKRLGNPTWQKGVSGNAAGRPKGSKNKTTEEIRKFIQEIVSGELNNFEEDLNGMNPFQRWMILEKVCRYFMPQLTKVDADVKGDVKIEVSFEDVERSQDTEDE